MSDSSGTWIGPAAMAVVQRIGEIRAARVRMQIAEEAQALGGINGIVEGDAVVLEGRGLLSRWIGDARLRMIGRNGI